MELYLASHMERHHTRISDQLTRLAACPDKIRSPPGKRAPADYESVVTTVVRPTEARADGRLGSRWNPGLIFIKTSNAGTGRLKSTLLRARCNTSSAWKSGPHEVEAVPKWLDTTAEIDPHPSRVVWLVAPATDMESASMPADRTSSKTFATKLLPIAPDTNAPDGSEVRVLLDMAGGGMAHFELAPGEISKPVTHRTVEEIWFFLTGSGQMWRKQGNRAQIADVFPGVCLTIPVGTHFQFRSFGHEPLAAIAVTMPPWPGEDEAIEVSGMWEPTVGK